MGKKGNKKNKNKNGEKKKNTKKKNSNKKGSNLPYIFLLIIGLLLIGYPTISKLYYRIDNTKQNSKFDKQVEQMSTVDIRKRMELARAYNASLHNIITEDPYTKESFTEEQKIEGRKEYAKMLEINAQIGHVTIPRIGVDLPIYAGTSETILQKGAGHLEGTSLPIGGLNTHSVITAHSGLPEAKMFTDIRKLQKGSKFYIKNIEGILAYQVDQIKVIKPSNFSDLLVEPGKDYCTLLTCTPIMINSHRLLVRGHRIAYKPGVDDREYEKASKKVKHTVLFASLAAILGGLGLTIVIGLRRKKKHRAYATSVITDAQNIVELAIGQREEE